jgi:hypothetical protein
MSFYRSLCCMIYHLIHGRDQHRFRSIVIVMLLNRVATNLIVVVVVLATCHSCIDYNINFVDCLVMTSYTQQYTRNRSLKSTRHTLSAKTTQFCDHNINCSCIRSTGNFGQRLSPIARKSLALWQKHRDDGDEMKDSLLIRSKIPMTKKSKNILFLQGTMSSFAHGAKTVHSQYLDIFWKYTIVQSLLVTLPLGLLLWASRVYAPSLGQQLYSVFYYPLYSLWMASSMVARILHWPLEGGKWIISRMPVLLVTVVESLPNSLAVPLVQAILIVNDSVKRVAVRLTENNNIFPLLSSVIAVLVWRPAVEEWEYRSVLNKLLFAPNMIQSKRFLRRRRPSSESMVEFIPLEKATNAVAPIPSVSPSNQLPSGQLKLSTTATAQSKRILLGSILFATTRLGWLAGARPATGNFDDSTWSSSLPYSWTIGFIQSVMAHFSSHLLPEVRPGLSIWILLLAIHQTVSTFLVAQHVFVTVYSEGGLAASMGAHLTWTISKGTIPLRVVGRLWRWWRRRRQH